MRIRHLIGGMALITACGGGSTGPTPPPPPPPPPAVASVSLSSSTVNVASGVTSHLTATALDASGGAIAGKTAAWTTLDAQIATVSSSGDVQGVKIGSTTIKATIDGKEATAAAQVTVGAPTAIVITAGNAQAGEVGAALPVAPKARVRDFGDNPVPSVSVQWAVGQGGGKLGAGATSSTDAAGLATGPIWSLGILPGANTLVATIGGLTATVTATASYTRVTADRTDEVAGSQVHIVYAVPADLTDRSLDLGVQLATSISVFQRFAVTKTNGRRVKIDTYNGGVPDVTFLRLTQTDAQILAAPTPQQGVEAALAGMGFIKPGKLYLVYYDGTSVNACAQGDIGGGGVSAVYLRGSIGAVPCPDLATGFAPTVNDGPRYWEFVGLHEMMHTMGIVGAAAPHYTAAFPGHVPEPTDLMFAGAADWHPAEIDIGNDDYSGAALPGGLPNFLTSPFTETVPVAILAAFRLAAAREDRSWRMPSGTRMAQIEGIAPHW